MIQASLNHSGFLEKIIAELDQEIARKLKDYHKEYELLQTIPGVKEQGAMNEGKTLNTFGKDVLEKAVSETHV